MSRRPKLREVSGRFGLLAIYLFGSRAEDGIRILHGEPLPRASSSDLDVGLLFADDEAPPEALAELQVVFEDLFAPCRVDLVPVRAVDPLFQFRIIDGDRIFALDARAADRYELEVMRSASELLPWQRQNELERYGISTS
jgi:predicted nucleotidyltransferase